MLMILGLFLIICVYEMKIKPGKGELAEYLSPGHTQSIKGVFILLVFFSHFSSYAQLSSAGDGIFRQFVLFFGQTMVTLFLFYSGYGVMESIRNKGEKYVSSMPVRRILATLFKFDVAVLLFALVTLGLGEHITWKQLLLSLVGWESVGNSNWYIFVILVLYAFTYIAFALFGKWKHIVPVLCVLVLTLLYMAAMAYWQIKPFWWYDTALCYSLGMLYSLYRNQAERLINKNKVIYLCVLVLLSCAFYVSTKLMAYPGVMYVRNLSFALLVVVTTMRISINNRVLQYCGRNLFELYILQRIPMMVLSRTALAGHPVTFFAISLLLTVLCVKPFQVVTEKVWKRIQSCLSGR